MLVGAITVVFTLIKYQENPNAAPNSTETHMSTNVIKIQYNNGKTFDLSIDDIPVYKAYVDSQDDIMTEIERTRYELIKTSTDAQFILLQYSCGNKHCSTLLIKVSDSEITSIALADGIFQDYKTSPKKDKLLIRYGFNEGGAVVRHLLIGIDLLEMKVIPFESTVLADAYMYIPTWPIVDYLWSSEEEFLMETSDLASSDFDQVKDWYAATDPKTKIVEVMLSKTKS